MALNIIGELPIPWDGQRWRKRFGIGGEVQRAIDQAELMADCQISSVYLALSGETY